MVVEVGRCFAGRNVFANETKNKVLYEYQCNYLIFYNRTVNSSVELQKRNREGFILLSVVLLVFFLLPCCLVCLHASCSSKNRSRTMLLIKNQFARHLRRNTENE